MRGIEDVLRPDPYWSTQVVIDPASGSWRLYQFSDFYNLTADLSLKDSVPVNIRQEFDAACHTFSYSWLSFDLATVAEHYAYAVLEMALRARLTLEGGSADDGRGLKALLQEAFRRNWLREEDYQLQVMRDTQPICQLRDVIVRLRNSLSHGHIHRFIQGSQLALEVCHDVIGKLFP